MIIRARPKYFRPHMITQLEKVVLNENNEKELFFSRGRDALKFLLNCYSSFREKQLVVTMQSFNCEVVLQAALEANCKVVLLDINLHDFSISLDALLNVTMKIDVLILTHYQGIPNQSYIEIANFCHHNDILLIDDLAQTEQSIINNCVVGELSDVSLKSYAFDKPITCFMGGSLDIATLQNTSFREYLIKHYLALPIETDSHAKNDLKLLEFLYKNSDVLNYFQELNNYNFARLFITFFSEKNTHILLKSSISKLIHLFWRYFSLLSFKGSNVMRLHEDKIKLIMLQRSKFKYNPKEITALEAYLADIGVKLQEYPENMICWNRYSFLDKEQKCKKFLNRDEIEFGNYNWPYPLHKLTTAMSRVILRPEGYANSEIAALYIINIPVWSNYFEGSLI